MMPVPQLPDPNTEQGKSQLAFSMLTCAQQIDSKIFAYMKHIRPRRALILDEQKQTVGTFPLFVHDGTRRGAPVDAAAEHVAESGDDGNILSEGWIDSSRRGGAVRDASVWAWQWLDARVGPLTYPSSPCSLQSRGAALALSLFEQRQRSPNSASD